MESRDGPYSGDLVQFLQLHRSSLAQVMVWLWVHHCYPSLAAEREREGTRGREKERERERERWNLPRLTTVLGGLFFDPDLSLANERDSLKVVL